MESVQNTATFTSEQRFSATFSKVQQKWTVGMPKEQNMEEYRVSMTPQTVREFILNGHTVFIETEAGQHAGHTDEEYTNAGAKIVKTTEEVYKNSQLITKVLAPTKNEMQYIRHDQTVMAFFNFNNKQNQTNNNMYIVKQQLFLDMMQTKATFIDYENIENDFGTLPMIQPMSEIAGQLSVQQGMKYLEKHMGGSGVLLGKIAGVQQSRVLVLGAGIAGVQAARMAALTGSQVTLMDISTETLRQLKDTMPYNVDTVYLSEQNLDSQISEADLVVGAVIPKNIQQQRFIVSKKQVEMMKSGSVIVDIAMWWGGNFETSKETTMQAPTFVYNNVTHFCATNIWSCVPRCSSEALSTCLLPFALQILNKKWQKAVVENNYLMNGVIVVDGKSTNEFLSKIYNTQYYPLENLVKSEIEQSNISTYDLIQLKQQLQQTQGSFKKSQFTVEA